MSKPTIRAIYLGGAVALVVGLTLLFAGIPGGTATTDAYGVSSGTPGNIPLFIAGIILVVVAAIPMFVAWLFALIRTARSGQWAWFVVLLVINAPMLVYIFVRDPVPAPPAPLYRR
jgi:hypothetical protein